MEVEGKGANCLCNTLFTLISLKRVVLDGSQKKNKNRRKQLVTDSLAVHVGGTISKHIKNNTEVYYGAQMGMSLV